MINFFLVSIFSSILISSSLSFNYSESKYIKNEIYFINQEQIDPSLYFFPIKYEISDNSSFFDLFDNNKFVEISPVIGIRYGTKGYELFKEYSPSNLLWITPGVEFNYIKPISISFFDTGISFQAWARFNKHSAYGFQNQAPENNLTLFELCPLNSFEFYTNSQFPENGIDFDEGEGAIAINSPWIDVIFGKFRSNIGPFLGSNLSMSKTSPGFPQIQLRAKSEKINFTYIIGDLYSNLFHEVNDSSIRRKRFIINHRIDIRIKRNFRIGFYEQVIAGDNLSLSYMIPIMPFWSAQHSLGDTDNLQMGFDIEYIKNKNRFYFSLIIDEWAPYDTFNSEHHNWFGGQFGYSRILSKNSFLKFEYTRIEPQVYTHDIPINEPFHYNYPIGFWSGGDSEEIFMKIIFNLMNMKELEVNFRHTVVGNPEYNINANFLEGENKIRSALALKMIKKNKFEFGPIDYILKIQHIRTENIYDIEKFTDCQISLLYNINY